MCRSISLDRVSRFYRTELKEFALKRLESFAIKKLEPKSYNQQEFEAAVNKRAKEIKRLCQMLANGDISARQWYDMNSSVLFEGYLDSWVMGRTNGGDAREVDMIDRLVARSFVDAESEYLLRFLEAIEARDTRYLTDDELDANKLSKRAHTYCYKFRGASGMAFTESSPSNAEFTWVMGAAEHCPDCPELAENSPYSINEIFVWPGDCTTACMFNCACHWQRDDGVSGFKPFQITL